MFTFSLTIISLLPSLALAEKQPNTIVNSSTIINYIQPRSDFFWPPSSVVQSEPSPTSTPATSQIVDFMPNRSLWLWSRSTATPTVATESTPTIPIPSATFTTAPQAPISFNPDDISWASWANPSTLTQFAPPAPPPKPSPEPESSPGDIFVCTDTAFRGTCEYFHNVTYQCHNLPANLQKQLSSIRPDKGQLCIFYDDQDCFGAAHWMRWPGSGNMRGRRFDNKVVSWRCTEDGCDGVQGPGGCSENPDGSPRQG